MSVDLVLLAAWILLSGLDDLFIVTAWLATRRGAFPWPADRDLEAATERRIAIFVPLWHEHSVIGRMLERNLAGIRYRNYEIFTGIYPNDHLTCRAVSDAAAQNPHIHAVLVPHDGPTSKGDCLNWIHRGMLDYEAERGGRFDVIVTHDAEDLIHPESLRLINWFSRDHQMIQIPVLALPTGLAEFTHGIYCDEFAEFQSKDIPVRQALGGFLPGNGVGTGFDRQSLERLASHRGGNVFDPDSLTEDYETGYLLHEMECRQIFVPLRFDSGAPVATREYFPRSFPAAVRQRSRWVAGICLQGWERHGWRGSWRDAYWWWRDRKGLVGNLLSPVANLLLIYCLFGGQTPRWTGPFWRATIAISLPQIAIRWRACARIYGHRFAAAVPLRIVWGNAVNFLATFAALLQFFGARIRKRVLAWRKTEHVYPEHGAPDAGRARLGDVLRRMDAVSANDLDEALENRPAGVRIGEHLLSLQMISEENLYRALSIHGAMPLGPPDVAEIHPAATRALPLESTRRWKVLPYRIDLGQLYVVTTEVPSSEMTHELAALCSLQLRFRLVRPSDFERMAREYFTASHSEEVPAKT